MKKIILGILLVLPILLIGAFWFAAGSLTSPVQKIVGNCPTELTCENVEFPSESGANIKGWFVQGQANKGVIVIMHGVRGDRNMPNRIKFLNNQGYSILAFDFQAHGESIGKQITFGYLESKDATASLKFIKQKLPNEKVGVLGISMGGAAYLLQKEGQKADALILEMVYPTMQKAIENRLNLWLFSGAENISPLLTWQFPMRLGVSVDELRPLNKMNDVNCPTLFIAGENDQHTTLAESRQLFDTANQPKQLWIVPQAEHGDLHKVAPKDYEEKVLRFFAETLRGEK
jgi:uncharacterized protein